MERIYLDNAATTWPKPPSVLEAIARFYRQFGAAVGRGSYATAESVGRKIHRLRNDLQHLIGARHSSEIAFAFNGTDALNTAIFGLVRPGDHVVATEAEHNSVLRPLTFLEQNHNVGVTIVKCESDGAVDAASVQSAIQSNTRLICLTHASNVTGAVNDVAEVGRLCRERSVSLLVDAAQTLGYVPIDVEQIGCDLLAAPGHKGLCGPLGTGLLYVRQAISPHVRPLRFGGTGTQSHLPEQPVAAPEKFESGNLDGGALFGLAAAIGELNIAGADGHDWRRSELFHRFTELSKGLQRIEGVRVLGPQETSRRVPVISILLQNLDSREAAELLSSRWNIECRAGFHCAPLICRRLETESSGGTIRFSPGRFTTRGQIETVLAAVGELATAFVNT